MSINTPSERLIFGPSHSVRLKHALASGQLPELSIPSRIIGVGGMPIWAQRIRKEIAAYTSTEKVFFIVGDFRFGNAVLDDPDFRVGDLPEKTYLSITKELINETNDQILFDLCQTTINSLNQQLKGNLRLLFWDLSIREYQNRATGRYQEAGVYRHPVWNLNDTLAKYSDIAVDTRQILEFGERLYIDSSAHPSLLGWLYILKLLRGDTYVDLGELIDKLDKSLQRLMADIVSQDSVLITGDSKFVRSLQFFVQKGHFQLPLNWSIQPLTKATESKPFEHCLYFPALCTYELNEKEIADALEHIVGVRQKLAAKHHQLSILYYDNWGYESISKRKDFLDKFNCKLPSGQTSNLERATCLSNQRYKVTDSTDYEGMIELNNFLLPTTLGVLEILARSTSHLDHTQVADAYQRVISDCYD